MLPTVEEFQEAIRSAKVKHETHREQFPMHTGECSKVPMSDAWLASLIYEHFTLKGWKENKL